MLETSSSSLHCVLSPFNRALLAYVITIMFLKSVPSKLLTAGRFEKFAHGPNTLTYSSLLEIFNLELLEYPLLKAALNWCFIAVNGPSDNSSDSLFEYAVMRSKVTNNLLIQCKNCTKNIALNCVSSKIVHVWKQIVQCKYNSAIRFHLQAASRQFRSLYNHFLVNPLYQRKFLLRFVVHSLFASHEYNNYIHNKPSMRHVTVFSLVHHCNV